MCLTDAALSRVVARYKSSCAPTVHVKLVLKSDCTETDRCVVCNVAGICKVFNGEKPVYVGSVSRSVWLLCVAGRGRGRGVAVVVVVVLRTAVISRA